MHNKLNILVIVSLLILILGSSQFIQYETKLLKEGLDVKSIAKDVVNGAIKPIETSVNKAVAESTSGINDTINQIKKGLDKVTVIEKSVNKSLGTVSNISSKIGGIFPKLAAILNNGIVVPITGIFAAIGNVFQQLVLILLEIANKIVGLPYCIPVYMIDGGVQTIGSIYKLIIPGWIRSIFSLVYSMFVEFPLWILYCLFVYPVEFIFGWDFEKWISSMFKSSCYKFDVNKQIKSMGTGFTNAAKNFSSNFGKMDFSKVF